MLENSGADGNLLIFTTKIKKVNGRLGDDVQNKEFWMACGFILNFKRNPKPSGICLDLSKILVLYPIIFRKSMRREAATHRRKCEP